MIVFLALLMFHGTSSVFFPEKETNGVELSVFTMHNLRMRLNNKIVRNQANK